MELRPYEAGDAAVVAGWAGTPEENLRWCSRPEVTAADVAGWAARPDVAAYGLVEDGELVAYGELWVDDDEAEVELARLVVAPGRRGRGIGRGLAAALVERARRHHPAVFLRVHPDNAAALRSYAAAGFVPVEEAEAAAWNEGQPVPYAWRRYAG